MFAKDFSLSNFERLGPILEQLLESGKLTDDEWWAVDLSGRAAADLASIRHSADARRFYARPDIEEQTSATIDSWLALNSNATAGTITAICGRMHVASVGPDSKLQLLPILNL